MVKIQLNSDSIMHLIVVGQLSAQQTQHIETFILERKEASQIEHAICQLKFCADDFVGIVSARSWIQRVPIED